MKEKRARRIMTILILLLITAVTLSCLSCEPNDTARNPCQIAVGGSLW